MSIAAGGHGIIYDGPKDVHFKALGEKFWAEGKIVSSVCHGPGGLVSVHAPDGTSIFKGKKVRTLYESPLTIGSLLQFLNWRVGEFF